MASLPDETSDAIFRLDFDQRPVVHFVVWS